MRVGLIDADILAYQAAATAEQAYDWGDGMWTLHVFEADAIAAFESSLARIKEKVEADEILLVFSDRNNWRKTVLPTYKSNRVKVRKPMLLSFLRAYATERYPVKWMNELEGDDVLGIIATDPARTDDLIICSLDKDFKTIPGNHYNFGKDEFFTITEKEADYWHMLQTLTGDATDGYSGCPGCGPKTAEKILKEAYAEAYPKFTDDQAKMIMWDHVVAAYEKAGLGYYEAIIQAQVARICRYQDYDHDNLKVKLWNPN